MKSNINSKWAEVRYLPVSLLTTNPLYKRHLDTKWVRHIIENFDEDLVGIPCVSYRNGKYFILDGQHLVKALAAIFNDPNYPVLCKIYYGLSEQHETELCMKLKTSTKPLDAFSSIKMQNFSGDKNTRRFLDCTAAAGFAITRINPRNSRYNIRAIKKAQECFQILGAEKYTFMLDTLLRTWDGAPWSVSSEMLEGMCLLIRSVDINQADFVKRLSRFTYDDIAKFAIQPYKSFRILKRDRIAHVLGTLYDKNLDLSMFD